MADFSSYDVVVIGAGSAGLGAAARLAGAGLKVVTLEAKDRVGGRAHTLHGRSGLVIDMGCGWLHSADQNAWAAMVEPMGFTFDRSHASWTKPALGENFPPALQREYRQVFNRFEELLEEAAEGEHDLAASDLFPEVEARWIPLLNAFSGYYNGAPFDRISVKDYAAYQPTEENWRVREGYGALITAFAGPLDVRLSTSVAAVEHGGVSVRVILADGGVIEARAVVLAVSSSVLAEERVRFDPPLPDKVQAAADLPLGNVEKAFLKLAEPEEFPVESRIYARIDTPLTPGYSLRPMGQPVIECFFGGDLAADLELEPDGALSAFAMDELVGVFGSGFRQRAEPIAESGWRTDPFIRGAYSHAQVGCSGARAVLAAPVEGRLFFAGEATSPHAFSTAHGAYETGVRAADEALVYLRPR